jgi:hypothetical protein
VFDLKIAWVSAPLRDSMHVQYQWGKSNPAPELVDLSKTFHNKAETMPNSSQSLPDIFIE